MFNRWNTWTVNRNGWKCVKITWNSDLLQHSLHVCGVPVASSDWKDDMSLLVDGLFAQAFADSFEGTVGCKKYVANFIFVMALFERKHLPVCEIFAHKIACKIHSSRQPSRASLAKPRCLYLLICSTWLIQKSQKSDSRKIQRKKLRKEKKTLAEIVSIPLNS